MGNLLYWIIIGGIAGWLAGLVMKGRGFGVLGNILVGIVGAVIGGWLLTFLQVGWNTLIGNLVTALLGAIVLLLAISVIKKA